MKFNLLDTTDDEQRGLWRTRLFGVKESDVQADELRRLQQGIDKTAKLQIEDLGPFDPKVYTGYPQETFSLPEGVVSFACPTTLSPESVDDLRDWLDVIVRKLRRTATPAVSVTDVAQDDYSHQKEVYLSEPQRLIGKTFEQANELAIRYRFNVQIDSDEENYYPITTTEDAIAIDVRKGVIAKARRL